MKGFYLTYDNKPVPPVVKEWDVKVLLVSPSKPHTVQKAQIEFWEAVDRQIMNKFHLNKSKNN